MTGPIRVTKDYRPLLERVEIVRHEDSDVPRVWYVAPAPEDATLEAGDWVVLVARVHSVRSSGGYRTGAIPPGGVTKPLVDEGPVARGLEFRLEQKEIYLAPVAEKSRRNP